MNKATQHKRAFITWLAIYPSITLILWLFGKPLMAVELPVRTLILTVVLVPLLSYVLIPYLNKVFHNWLNK